MTGVCGELNARHSSPPVIALLERSAGGAEWWPAATLTLYSGAQATNSDRKRSEGAPQSARRRTGRSAEHDVGSPGAAGGVMGAEPT